MKSALLTLQCQHFNYKIQFFHLMEVIVLAEIEYMRQVLCELATFTDCFMLIR